MPLGHTLATRLSEIVRGREKACREGREGSSTFLAVTIDRGAKQT